MMRLWLHFPFLQHAGNSIFLPRKLPYFGSHFIVKYRDLEELKFFLLLIIPFQWLLVGFYYRRIYKDFK